ncbi:GNAT family N-acetyltransferase [Achromobacter xylosoxidans]
MAPASVLIERACEQHVPGITALHGDPDVARHVLQLPYPSLERWRKRMEQDSERRVGLVATVQGEVAGYASLEQFERVRRSHCGSVGIAVAKGWHGQGIGSRLLGALLDVADNWMNLRRVELMVYTDNEPAIALYRKHGFEVEGELRDYAVRDAAMSTPMPWPGCATPTRVECRAGRWPAHSPALALAAHEPAHARPARRQQRRRPQERRGPVGRLERPAPHLENAGQRGHRGAQGPEEAAQHDAQHAPALDESRRAQHLAHRRRSGAHCSSAGPTFTPSA